MTSDSKRPYETPTITVIGSFEEVTQATHSGSYIDGFYSRGTPTSQGVLS